MSGAPFDPVEHALTEAGIPNFLKRRSRFFRDAVFLLISVVEKYWGPEAPDDIVLWQIRALIYWEPEVIELRLQGLPLDLLEAALDRVARAIFKEAKKEAYGAGTLKPPYE